MSRTQEALWQKLHHAGLVQGETPAKNTEQSPWFIKLLLAISGWLAALFLMGFIGIGLSNLWREPTTALFIGLIMIGIAYIIFRSLKNEFAEHLALAISLAGQGWVVFALFELIESESLPFILTGFLQLLLIILMPHYLHRIFSSFSVAVAFSIAMISLNLPFVFSSALLLAAAWIWLHEFDYPQYLSILHPVGYGLVLALLVIKGSNWFGDELWGLGNNTDENFIQPWMGELLSGIVALWIVSQLLLRHSQALTQPFSLVILIGTLFVCAASVKAEGITIGTMILILGFANSNRILMAIGILSLLTYISAYYYLLDTTLLNKSFSLLLIGVVLLVLRWVLLKFTSAQEGK